MESYLVVFINVGIYVGLACFLAEYTWNIRGIYVECTWNIRGIYVEYTWNIRGTSMFSGGTSRVQCFRDIVTF